MNRTLVMAFRNTGRNRRRSLLAAISIITAMLLVVFMQGLIVGMMDGLVENTTRLETGHIRIAHPEFEKKQKFMPFKDYIPNPDSLIGILQADTFLNAQIDIITPRTNLGVLMNNDGKNRASLALSGDPTVEGDLLLFKDALIEGRYLEGKRDLVMGKEMAKMLNFKLGDTVQILSPDIFDALQLRNFYLIGIFETGIVGMDKNMFQVGVDDARILLNMEEGAQQIIIMLHDYRQADKVATYIKDLIGSDEVAVTSWTKLGFVYQYMTMANTMYNFIYLIITLFGAFIIGNIMMMVVLERRREIGIMKALGFKRGQVRTLFLLEGLILGVIGTVVGMGLGLLLILVINMNGGFDVSEMLGGADGFYFTPQFLLKVGPLQLLKIFAIGVGTSTVVTLIPSYRASKMSVVKAIRGN